MLFFIGFGIFISVVFLIEGVYYTYQNFLSTGARRMRRRLSDASTGGYDYAGVDLLRKDVISDIPRLNRLLSGIPPLRYLDRLLKQAGVRYNLCVFILLSFVFFAMGVLAVQVLNKGNLLAFLAGAGAGILPTVYVRLKKQKRMRKFESQLPGALDMIAQSLRAGHAFSGGLKIVADEFDDPVGAEFSRTLHEVNFGISIQEALEKLSRRVDCPDLKYFVVSVIVQQETGGNLAEILENSSHLIRERFKLQGAVQALSAEGRLSAGILIALPVFLTFILYIISPSYIGILFTDSIGKKTVAFAVFMMASGFLIIKRMVRIKA